MSPRSIIRTLVPLSTKRLSSTNSVLGRHGVGVSEGNSNPGGPLSMQRRDHVRLFPQLGPMQRKISVFPHRTNQEYALPHHRCGALVIS